MARSFSGISKFACLVLPCFFVSTLPHAKSWAGFSETSSYQKKKSPHPSSSDKKQEDKKQEEQKQPDQTQKTGFWSKVWGKPSADSAYLGMWTFHFNPSSRDSNWRNNLVGLSYHGYFVGAFINSFGDPSYALGVQRDFFQPQTTSNFKSKFGYRLGVIQGYDGRIFKWAEYTPIIPFFQINYELSYKWVGLQIGYSWVVLSAGFFFRYDF